MLGLGEAARPQRGLQRQRRIEFRFGLIASGFANDHSVRPVNHNARARKQNGQRAPLGARSRGRDAVCAATLRIPHRAQRFVRRFTVPWQSGAALWRVVAALGASSAAQFTVGAT